MAYPTDSPQRWAFDASADTADPGAFADVGFVADDPARYDWLNYTLENHGEWLTYLEDIAPADGVLRFREWECPDDSAYDLRWSGSTDGLLEGTLDAMQILVNVKSFVEYDGGPNANALLRVSATGVDAGTNLTGGSARVLVSDPTAPADDAGLTVDVDSGDVTLHSDYGSVSTTGTHTAGDFEWASAVSMLIHRTPIHYDDLNGTGNSGSNGSSVSWSVTQTGITSGDDLCIASLGPSPAQRAAPSSPIVITAANVRLTYVTPGVGGDPMDFVLMSATADGSLSTHGTATYTPPASGPYSPATVAFTISFGAVVLPGTLFLKAVSGGTSGVVNVRGVDITYNAPDIVV